MIINGQSLLDAAPIVNMAKGKEHAFGVSWGLGEAGYDIRIKQEIHFQRGHENRRIVGIDAESKYGRFVLASAIEEFQMPDNLTGVVHDKSTWARRGLSVFNTVIEPGWKGFLTLELVYHGEDELIIPAGSGIAQVLFSLNSDKAVYAGKYQNQEDKPVSARNSL